MEAGDRKVGEEESQPSRGRPRRQGGRQRGRGRGRVTRGQDRQDGATRKPFQDGQRGKDRQQGGAGRGVAGGGKTLDAAVSMLVSRYGNMPIVVERYDNYILDATAFTLLVEEVWNGIAIYDSNFLANHSSVSFFYGCYLMLLKRVATIRAGTIGGNSVITNLLRDIPDYPVPQAVGLYLDGVGTVKMEDGTILVPDLVLLGIFGHNDGEFSRIVRLSEPDEADRFDHAEKMFPLFSCFMFMRNQVNPGHAPPNSFPDVGVARVGYYYNYQPTAHCFSMPLNFTGNHGIFGADDVLDVLDTPPEHLSFCYWTRSLSDKIRDTMFSVKVYTPIVVLPVSLVGDISQLAIATFSDDGRSAKYGHFRKSSGFSLHAARIFGYRRGRPATQVVNPANAGNFADDYVKIHPPEPRHLFETTNFDRLRRAYVNAFFHFREP